MSDTPHKHVAMPGSDWEGNRQHVHAELKRLSHAQKEGDEKATERHLQIIDKISEVKVEVAGLKGRAAAWGAIAAMIVQALIALALHAK